MATYAEWAETHESDIKGKGFGSDHHWHYESTPSNTSYYKCAKCFVPFGHNYNSEPDIFEAMKKSYNVTDKCARTQLWPIRLEYASKDEIERYSQMRNEIGATK